jgi:hypothetical protein
MTEEIVDRLEAVDIGDADRKGRRIVCAFRRQFADLVHQPTPIAQSCQRVGVGHGVGIG